MKQKIHEEICEGLSNSLVLRRLAGSAHQLRMTKLTYRPERRSLDSQRTQALWIERSPEPIVQPIWMSNCGWMSSSVSIDARRMS